jgi:uncharacterized Zn-binding protein involved in type VI secretion
MMTCSFGAAPAVLSVLPTSRVLVEGKPAATVADSVTALNIPPFGMCSSLANPTVASATAAALGTLTPMPCVPVPTAWVPGSPTVLVGGKPALNQNCKCTCAYGGVIQLTAPSAVRTMVP